MHQVIRLPKARELVSFEAVLVVFLTVGQFKALPALSWIQNRIDLTLAASTLVFLSAFVVGLANNRRLILPGRSTRYLALYGGLLALILVSYAATSSTAYSTEKVTRVAYFNSVAVLGPLIVMQSRKRIVRFLRLLVTFSLLGFGLGLLTGGSETRLLGVASEDSYQGLGRLAGVGFAVVFMSLTETGFRIRQRRLLGALIAGVLVLALVASGARQGILGGLVVILYTVGRRSGVRKRRRFTASAGAVVGVACMAVALFAVVASQSGSVPGAGGGRRLAQTAEIAASGQLGLEERFQIWGAARSDWASEPLTGVGFGNFGVEIEGALSQHPHNIILEVAAELGVVGALIGGAFLLLPLRCAFHARARGGLATMVGAVFLFLLTVAGVSGDLADNRMLFAVGSVLVVASSLSEPGPSVKRTLLDDRLRDKRGVSRASLEPMVRS